MCTLSILTSCLLLPLRKAEPLYRPGVDVTIMVSSASDIPFTPDAALYKLHKLMKRGATVYMYNGGFHHSKIMMVDDLFCTVGTANLNSRSLRYDYETNAFIFDKKTTAELNSMFHNDIEHCTQLTPEFWKKRSPWKSSSDGLRIYSPHFVILRKRVIPHVMNSPMI